MDNDEIEKPEDEGKPESAWCIVASVVNDRPYGEGGNEIRHGTKHFAPGAKVYIVSFFWGMGGETLTVVGRHHKTHRFMTLKMPSKWLVNWRVELVYSPHVIQEIIASEEYKSKMTFSGAFLSAAKNVLGMPEQHWAASENAKARAEEIVEDFKKNYKFANVIQPPTTRLPQIKPLSEEK